MKPGQLIRQAKGHTLAGLGKHRRLTVSTGWSGCRSVRRPSGLRCRAPWPWRVVDDSRHALTALALRRRPRRVQLGGGLGDRVVVAAPRGGVLRGRGGRSDRSGGRGRCPRLRKAFNAAKHTDPRFAAWNCKETARMPLPPPRGR